MAEDYVGEQLQDEGWVVVARNWRGHGGELDLVVQREDALRFVEVKAREPGDDSGLDAMTVSKCRKLVRAAEAWLLAHGLPEGEACFLVALVTMDPAGWSVEWIDDAFDAY